MNRRGLQLLLAWVLALTTFAAEEGLVLRIEPSEVTVKSGQNFEVRALIENRTSRNVTLVSPGDGSESGMRTPVISWRFFQRAKKDGRPVKPFPSARCGNMNAIRAEEIFVLKPGESKRINVDLASRAGYPEGKYRATLEYWNEPKRKRTGLAQEDSKVIKSIEKSTPCKVVSNEIMVTVMPPE